MSAFNKAIKAPKTYNYEGARSFKRTSEMDLLLLATSSMTMSNTFYERAESRYDKMIELTHKVAVSNPEWMEKFVGWLRNKALMRTSALIVGIEAAHALSEAGTDSYKGTSPRRIAREAFARADEPGEALAFWKTRHPDEVIPTWLKRAIADGASKLYNEYSVLKYDSQSKNFRIGDVINLTHPKPEDGVQKDVFKMALDSRYGNVDSSKYRNLGMLEARKALTAITEGMSPEELSEFMNSDEGRKAFKSSGYTWENVLSNLEGTPKDKWTAMLPNMGYMAILRNLRNFENADLDEDTWEWIYEFLANPENVAKSKQLPFRFMDAFKSVDQGHFKLHQVLETAGMLSISNMEKIPGRTLILEDRSGSMCSYVRTNPGSKAPAKRFVEVAALFAASLAKTCEKATLVQFETSSVEVSLKKTSSVLKYALASSTRGGTDVFSAIQSHYSEGAFDRVVVITDEQYWGSTDESDVYSTITDCPVYVWNLVGYSDSSIPTGKKNVYQLGGLSNESYKMLNNIENGIKGVWPWELNAESA